VTERHLISCVGDVSITRRYGYCRHCRQPVVALDDWAGLQRDSLTPRGRRLAIYAGTGHSFDEASEQLQEMCGIRVSDQTIRRACEQCGQQAKAYLEQADQPYEAVRDGEGERELSVDGAKVNTIEGWREIRGVIACRRPPGEPAGVRQWDKRDLPKPAARVAWAGIADSDQVGQQIKRMTDRLGWRGGRQTSVLGDGAVWIWKQVDRHLPHHEPNLDIYHNLEHLHQAGRALHGQDSEQAKRWAECQRAKIFRYGTRQYLRAHLRPAIQAHRRDNPEGESTKALIGLYKYLAHHHRRQNYRDRLRRGLPIGSGQIEGLCKNTLNRRLRKNSPRWRPERAEHMAALCCLRTCDLWDTFWKPAA